MDYQGLYEDLLAMERKLIAYMFCVPAIEEWTIVDRLYQSCRNFRIDLLERFYSPIGHVHV